MNNAERAVNAITWIDRLLVTRFKQGHSQLGNKETGFCCLGFGCYINEINYNPDFGDNSEFAEAVGLITVTGGYLTSGSQISERALVNLNDNGQSFNQISKAMRAEPEAYFEEEVAELITEHFTDKP